MTLPSFLFGGCLLAGRDKSAEALHDEPRPDILVAPSMSPGARKAARDAGVGWVDESGAAEIYYRDPKSGTVIAIETKGSPPAPLDTRLGWRPAALAVCEALLAERGRSDRELGCQGNRDLDGQRR